jgi:hypothetical protein
MRIRTIPVGSHWFAGGLLMAFSLVLAAQAQPPTADEAASIRSFLGSCFGALPKEMVATKRYDASIVDLTDRGARDVIVYFTGPRCGTGGCGLLVLEPEGSSYRVITSTTIGWPPIRVLSSKTNGWHDLGIWVAGGGIQPGYEARLQFDGKTYPRNPSVAPASRIVGRVAGEVVVSGYATGLPLY